MIWMFCMHIHACPSKNKKEREKERTRILSSAVWLCIGDSLVRRHATVLSSVHKLTCVCMLCVVLPSENESADCWYTVDSHLFDSQKRKKKSICDSDCQYLFAFLHKINYRKFEYLHLLCFVFFLLLLLSEDRYNRVSIEIDSLEKNIWMCGTTHYKTRQKTTTHEHQ